MSREVKNAIITEVHLGLSRDIYLDMWVHVSYGAGGQGFGGFVLGFADKDNLPMQNVAGHFITRVLSVVGVTRLGDMEGKTIRVDAEDNTIHGIGHIVKDNWFYPRADLKAIEVKKSLADLPDAQKAWQGHL